MSAVKFHKFFDIQEYLENNVNAWHLQHTKAH